MPLNPQIMIDAIKTLTAGTEAEATTSWGNMLVDYMKTATGILPTGFTPAVVTAIKSSLIGMSAPGAAAALIQAAFATLWAQMIAAPATFFAGATLITPPPTLGVIAADLAAAFPVNITLNGSGTPPSTGTIDGDRNLAATVLVLGAPLVPGTGFHLRNQGGTYTTPGPVVVPIV